MKTIFDSEVRAALCGRISLLQATSTRHWGSMTVGEMVEHCRRWDEMIITNRRVRRPLIGILLGRFFLKQELTEKPIRQNVPTVPALKVSGFSGGLTEQKQAWIRLIEAYETYNLPDGSFIHPFFGKLTRAQVGIFAYKHCDHHLRQFGC